MSAPARLEQPQLRIVDGARGELEINSESSLAFSGVSTPEGFWPRCELEGSMNAVGTVRTLDFDARVERLPFDARLIDALPPTLQRFITGMGLAGDYSGRIEGVLSIDETKPESFRIAYSGKDITAENASMEAPSWRQLISPSQTGTSGEAPTKAVQTSVPPETDSRWTVGLTASYTYRKPSAGSGAPVEPMARSEDRSAEGQRRQAAIA